MKHIYRYWRELRSKKEGYSVAEITFYFEASDDFDTVHYGKERKTLQAAINDAKRFFKKNEDKGYNYSIYANAILTDYYDDGTMVRKPDNDCARLGTLDPDGEYFDMCEPVDWMDKA